MGKVLISYRGDRTSARQAYRKMERKALKRWKINLLKVWNLNPVTLWQGRYVNDDVREAIGIEENFLESTKDLKWFGVKLTPKVSTSAVLSLSEDDKDILRDKCIAVFRKYGKKIEVAYSSSNAYDYKIYKKTTEIISSTDTQEEKTITTYIETDFEGEKDEELALRLYSRLVMYMIDNDSTDTEDKWSDIHPGDVDFFGGDVRSKLKYFTYEFNEEDILKVINDRLFVKRNYKVMSPDSGLVNKMDSSGYSYSQTIDEDLLEVLIAGNSISDNITDTFGFIGSNGSYVVDYDVVAALPPKELMFFIQTHITTFHKVKKKWYQSGLFGMIVIIIAVVIAFYTGQWQLVGFVVGISGALLGNQVMMIGGSMISLAGAIQSTSVQIAANNAVIGESSQQLAQAGVSQAVIESTMQQISNDVMVSNAIAIGRTAFTAYNTFSNLVPTNQIMPEATTPAESLDVILQAENDEWDFVWKIMPEYIIASTMKIM